MTSPKEVPLTLRDAGPPPDEIDGLLRAFFRAELPDPWPVLKSPAADENPVAVRTIHASHAQDLTEHGRRIAVRIAVPWEHPWPVRDSDLDAVGAS